MALSLDEYTAHDGLGLAERVKAGDVSARELVDTAIAACEQVNGSLNAVVTEMFDAARARADQALGSGPFAGVPFLMKDFGAEVAGVRFTEGTAFLADHVPDTDSEFYTRICAAGLLTIGKTNLPELAIGTTTESPFLGVCRNPWDTNRTTGGSSGGAGAAVAARVVPMAHANDIGGSTRIPASCCGLVGLKPSRGRVSLAPHYGDVLAGFFQELVVTRSVRDTAAVLDAVAGPAAGEPYLATAPGRTFLSEVGAPVERLKIGFSTRSPLGDPIDPECERAIVETARLCESLGHEVTEAAPEFDALELWQDFTRLISTCAAWMVDDWARRIGKTPAPEHFTPFVWAFQERGRSVSASEYLLTMQDLQRELRRYGAFFDHHHMWLTTTLGKPPVELGTLVYDGDPIGLRRRMAEFSPFTYISNASGQPAVSLPLHWTDSGLPVGLHFVGPMGEESMLLRLAAQLEAARPWEHRRPAVSVG
jgi:amidase